MPNSFEVAEFGGGGPVGRFGWSATWLWIIPLGIVLARYHDQLCRYVKGLAAVCLAYQMALAVRWGLNPFVLFPRIDSRLSARDSLFPPGMRQGLPSFYFFDVRSDLRHAPNVVAIAFVVLLLLSGGTMAMMNSAKKRS